MHDDSLEVDVCQTEGAHAGGVDHPAARVGQLECDRRGRRVSPPTSHIVHLAGGPACLRHKGIHQCRLADPGVSDEDADPPGEGLTQGIEAVGEVGPGRHEMPHAERGIVCEEVVGGGQVGLGEHEQRLHSCVVGGDEAPVDHAGTRFGIGEGRDNDELVGVGDDDPLDGIGVVGCPPQDRRTLMDAHDACEGVRAAPGVTDEPDAVADDDPLATEFTSPHGQDDTFGVTIGGHRAPADEHRVAASVHADDEPVDRIGVGRAVLGAWPAAASVGPDPDVGLVITPDRSCHRQALIRCARLPLPATMSAHRVVKVGRVLPTVATSSTRTPGTTRPRRAPAMTIRWSA